MQRLEVRKTLERPLPRDNAKSGPANACMSETLMLSGAGRLIEPGNRSGLEVSTSKGGSGLSSNDGGGSTPLPARSDGLDNIDGGPDAAFYIQLGVI